jgi:hypothetical protein
MFACSGVGVISQDDGLETVHFDRLIVEVPPPAAAMEPVLVAVHPNWTCAPFIVVLTLMVPSELATDSDSVPERTEDPEWCQVSAWAPLAPTAPMAIAAASVRIATGTFRLDLSLLTFISCNAPSSPTLWWGGFGSAARPGASRRVRRHCGDGPSDTRKRQLRLVTGASVLLALDKI